MWLLVTLNKTAGNDGMDLVLQLLQEQYLLLFNVSGVASTFNLSTPQSLQISLSEHFRTVNIFWLS